MCSLIAVPFCVTNKAHSGPVLNRRRADAEITGQRVTRTRIEPDHALTPELRVSDQDDSLVQIDIADREPHGFPNAHSRDREQPDQSRHRCRT